MPSNDQTAAHKETWYGIDAVAFVADIDAGMQARQSMVVHKRAFVFELYVSRGNAKTVGMLIIQLHADYRGISGLQA